MEKVGKFFKSVFWIIIVIFLLSTICAFAMTYKSTRDWLSSLFNKQDININSFDGADINWNGGLTKKQIAEQKADVNCPAHSDVNDIIYIQDYNDFVCFYKSLVDENGKTFYPNIVFVKTNDGLKFDGALNMYGKAVYYPTFLDTLNPFYPYTCGPKSYYVEQQNDKIPDYWYNDGFSTWLKPRTNLCIFDSSDASFYCVDGGWCKFSDGPIDFYIRRQESSLKVSQKYIIDIYNKYFLKFYNDNVEIIQEQNNSKVAAGDFNFFYDYLYRSSLSYDFGKDENGNALTSGTCSVDVSDLTVYPLPKDLLTTYVKDKTTTPITYFSIYKCNVFMTCNYTKCNVSSIYAGSTSVANGLSDDIVEKKDIPAIALSSLQILLNPKESTYLNATIRSTVTDSPVTIQYFDTDNKLVRSVVFSSGDFTNCVGTKSSALAIGSYTYKIFSDQLLFDSFSGSLSISSSGSLNYTYKYMNGLVCANFSICPISNSIDYSSIDFKTYPVKIVLNSLDNSSTYQYIFDSISKINVVQSQFLKLGQYRCSILSQKLIFGSINNTIDITPSNRSFAYTFDVNYSQSDLAFTIKVSESSSSTSGLFAISSDSSSVALLQDKLKLTNYLVKITIFDSNGNIVETFNHDHSGTGTCSDIWSTPKLVAGTNYTAQMTYCNDDDSISYESATFSFNYKLLTCYTLAYSCSKV